jgi:hypothetical protein
VRLDAGANRAERLLIGELLSHNQDGICFLLSGPRGLLAPCLIYVQSSTKYQYLGSSIFKDLERMTLVSDAIGYFFYHVRSLHRVLLIERE